MILLGYCEKDITPERPMALVGFYREDNMSKGVLNPLLAQLAVFEDDGKKVCLITIDSLGFTKELSDKLRTRIAAKLNITTEQVMLCFSHTHSAPNADLERDYFEDICEKLEWSAGVASNSMRPVLLGWKNTYAKIGVNRRTVSKDTDDRVGILKICDEVSGMPRLLILRLTAHANVLKRDNYMISSDYFGAVRELVQKNYSCPVMIIQGSAGNTAPKYFWSEETPVDAATPEYIRSQNALYDMAQAVNRSISSVIQNINLKRDANVKMYSEYIELESKVPSDDEAKSLADEALEMSGIEDSGWLQKVAELNSRGIHRQTEKVELAYLKIGDWCICGAPYELMVGFALETSKKLNNEFFYMNGYTNGCLLYFPTEDEFDRGGYEVFWSMLIYYVYIDRVYPFNRDAASKLIDFAVEKYSGAIKQRAIFCWACGAKLLGKFCTECGTKADTFPSATDSSKKDRESKFAGKKIIGLKYHRSGTANSKYLTIKPDGDGFELIESTVDNPWPKPETAVDKMLRGSAEPEENRAHISKEEGEKLFSALVGQGVLDWDGFSGKNLSAASMLDGRDGFSFSLVFESDEQLRASGTNAYPPMYFNVVANITGLFAIHLKYNRYYPSQFPNEEPKLLQITVGRQISAEIKVSVELSKDSNKWWLTLKDVKGKFLAENTMEIDSGELNEDDFGAEAFINLLKKYGFDKLNGKSEGDSYNEGFEPFNSYIVWDNRRAFNIKMNINVKEYEAFISELIDEAIKFRERIKK
ncbi:MAG: zinc ribbon domain-containing protein [Lachnospiraceae bacterium]|nr:zinc ribbon domain-containing protein [Lachnospiraceae bacterium]